MVALRKADVLYGTSSSEGLGCRPHSRQPSSIRITGAAAGNDGHGSQVEAGRRSRHSLKVPD